MRQALDSLGRLYTELASKAGEAIGVADYEPFWNYSSTHYYIQDRTRA